MCIRGGMEFYISNEIERKRTENQDGWFQVPLCRNAAL